MNILFIVVGLLLVTGALAASSNSWTLAGGTLTPNEAGVFPGGSYPHPGTRSGGASWRVGNYMYIFGGATGPMTANPDMCDMWKSDISSQNVGSLGYFTFIGGPKVANQYGVYSGTNPWPGCRHDPVTWTYGNSLYMFGGFGYSQSSGGMLNDLWRFDIATGKWIFLGGSTAPGQAGSYTSPQWPGARFKASAWVDNKSGRLFMFGGATPSSNPSQYNYMNDLWYYKPSSGAGPFWAFLSGSSLPNQNPVTTGTSLTPGSRWQAHTWTDNNGLLWLFGGGNANCYNGPWNGWSSKIYGMNDLWYYDPTTYKWFFSTYAGNNVNCMDGGSQSGATAMWPGSQQNCSRE